jgi:hypothetical protein
MESGSGGFDFKTSERQHQCGPIYNMDHDKKEDGTSPSQEIDFCTLGMFIIGKKSKILLLRISILPSIFLCIVYFQLGSEVGLSEHLHVTTSNNPQHLQICNRLYLPRICFFPILLFERSFFLTSCFQISQMWASGLTVELCL